MIYALTKPNFLMPVGQQFKRVSATDWKIIFNGVEYECGASVSAKLELIKDTQMEEVA